MPNSENHSGNASLRFELTLFVIKPFKSCAFFQHPLAALQLFLILNKA